MKVHEFYSTRNHPSSLLRTECLLPEDGSVRFLRRFPVETRRSALVLLGFFAVVAILGALRLQGQTSSLCGNHVVNTGEECDEGFRNGSGPNCTVNCTTVRCGDGIVSQSVGEECDSGTGAVATCGKVCTQPVCTDDGETCSGGCTWAIVSCTASSSSGTGASSLSAASLSSAQSVAASSGSSSASALVAAIVVSAASSAAPQAAVSSVVSAAASSVLVVSSVASETVQQEQSESSETIEVVASSVASESDTHASSEDALPPEDVLSDSTCGDGWVQPEEQCDDGNTTDDDGCSATCERIPMTIAHCGDLVIDEGEECDFGVDNSNVLPDSCRTNCRRAYCGDGVVDTGEACDDGNAHEWDGCTWDCRVRVCGNGIIEGTEECDLGEANSNTTPNACRTTCRSPRCGDGVKDLGEECDDANVLDGDGCTSLCSIVCPEGSEKREGRCLVFPLEEETCGVLCKAGNVWEGFVNWVFGWFE